ncbi:trypsin-like serine protease [Sorangium sp. So ce296]|uniref:trypsin-like serine protease n=1 Tax=Sorangium sp. So ce296 TaxID=3133296 RepID=UPI003F63540D
MRERNRSWCVLIASASLALGCGSEALEPEIEDVESDESAIIAAASARAREGTQILRGLVRVQHSGGSCSGVLYRNNWVLTAQHCTGGSVQVTLADVTQTAVQKVNAGNNIGMLRVPTNFVVRDGTTPYSNTNLLSSASASTLPGTAVRCYGRGDTYYVDGGPDTDGGGLWRYASLSIARANSEFYTIVPNSLGQITAPGDSGGPCYKVNGDSYVLTGIVEGGRFCLVGGEYHICESDHNLVSTVRNTINSVSE